MPFIPRELYYPTRLHVSHLVLLPQENSPRGYRPGTHILLSPKLHIQVVVKQRNRKWFKQSSKSLVQKFSSFKFSIIKYIFQQR